jgi:hypothetical protein
MPRTLGTAISDEDDLILHRASDLLDALPWQRVRNLHTPRCEWMVGQPEAMSYRATRQEIPANLVKKSRLHSSLRHPRPTPLKIGVCTSLPRCFRLQMRC